MHWMFLISADCESRAPARVLQILDNQRVSIISLLISTAGAGMTIRAVVDGEREKVSRVQQLLRKLPSIETVECRSAESVELWGGAADATSCLRGAAAAAVGITEVNHQFGEASEDE